MKELYHVLGLHMHQPPGNLKLLIETNNWQAREIMLCYDRPLKYAWRYSDVGRFAVGFSGILLEQFQDQEIIEKYLGIIDIPRMVKEYGKALNIEIIGMGYYHPIFPLIPKEDWDAQLKNGREKLKELFGREPKGFWPPEMAFTMEMIPFLKKNGYEYVIIDSVHIKPKKSMSKEDLVYSPHIAEYEDEEIVVIPRDRDISNAQESGLDLSWFENEVLHKTERVKRRALITSWTDGENGGWFRQIHEESGFWGHFFAPYMEKIKKRQSPVKTTSISEFIKKNPPSTRVDIKTGAWNVGSASGYDFSQWAGSESQKKAIKEVWDVSRLYHGTWKELKKTKKTGIAETEKAEDILKRAEEFLLRSETSCYLFWGDAWLPSLYNEIISARELITEAREKMNM
ncbi:MAG: glycoside hydrolase family 57 [Nitrospirota bacterium]